MKVLLIIISFVGLVLTLFPSFLVFNQSIDLADGKLLMLIGSVIWLTIAPLWINKGKKA